MTVSYENYRRQALHQIDNLAKPPGSLGLLEKQAKQILLAWGTFHRELRPKHIIFAADNGVVQAGVVAQLADITYMQSCHMVQGTSAVTCFCRSQDIPYEVVDVGIDSDDAVGLDRKIARGTKNFAVEPAMSREQLVQARRRDANGYRQLPKRESISCRLAKWALAIRRRQQLSSPPCLRKRCPG